MRRVAGVPWQEQHGGEPRRVRQEEDTEAREPAREDSQDVGSGLRDGQGRMVDFEELEWEPVGHDEVAGAEDDETAR